MINSNALPVVQSGSTDTHIIAQDAGTKPDTVEFLPTDGFTLQAAVDAEWGSDKQILTVQLSLKSGNPSGGAGFEVFNVVFFTARALEIHSREEYSEICDRLGVQAVFDEENPADWFQARLAESVRDVVLKMYYSPVDLWAFFGLDELSSLGRRNHLSQKRRLTFTRCHRSKMVRSMSGAWYRSNKQCMNITGQFGVGYTLDDLKGNSPGSFKDLADSVAVKVGKDILDPDTGKPMPKDRMELALAKNPGDFIRYAVEDAAKLHELRDEFNQQISQILHDLVGVDVSPDKIKGTNGALVADAFKRWLYSLDPRMPYAVRKLGRLSLKLNGEKLENIVDLRDVVHSRIRRRGIDWAESAEAEKLCQAYLKVPYESTALGGASSAEFGLERSSLAFAALVQGGRAVNEAPHEFQLDRGVDIDMSGCYGSSLARFTYPVGLPSTLAFSQEEGRKRNLGWLMDGRHAEQFVPGLWQATVTGGLKFDQDLIFSKKTDIGKIRRAALGKGFDEHTDLAEMDRIDRELSQFGGEFALTRREIKNGIITHEVWRAIQAVAAKKEMSGIRGLRVEAVAFYKASDRCESVKDWVTKVMAHKGGLTAKEDARTRAWVGLPIGEFLGPLLAERKRVKAEMKQAEPGSDEYARLNARQTLLKLFINTLYGCLASPFFEISNAVVANNITASARVGAWQMAKALGSVQSITDGGAHPLQAVRFMAPSARKPGLATLADYQGWHDSKKGRTLGHLGGLDWSGKAWDDLLAMTANQAEKHLNRLALAHIEAFWAKYDLPFEFDVEYKAANTFERMAYWNKTDYAMLTVQFADTKPKPCKPFTDSNGRVHDVSRLKIKVRGERFDWDKPETVAPKIELLLEILAGGDRIPAKTAWIQTRLRKVTSWARNDFSHDPDEVIGMEEVSYRGSQDSEGRPKAFVLYRNHNQPTPTYADLNKREKRRTGYEKFADLGLSKMHSKMVRDFSPE